MERRLFAFGWYGGKQKHLDCLLPYFPRSASHFVDVFGGSASVVLNANYPIRTYNDLDGEVVNFFRQLRDNPDALVSSLVLTPYARDELHRACEEYRRDGISDLERARLFFVRVRQARDGFASTTKINARTWQRSTSHLIDRTLKWMNGVERLVEIVDALASIQIDNDPAEKILEYYDDANTFFYCDPPYVLSTRTGGEVYRFEMSDEQHVQLARKLNAIQGRAMVSGYRSEIYDNIFPKWTRIDFEPQYASSADAERQESIWINYRPDKPVPKQDKLGI